ncbi:MAG TPA: sensor domain-containing diguanylate cyclase [Chloroflexota bacterium]|nr:sensor domain-containing diguanylate cyclase [Chloroflexota bacterium]
MTSSSDPNELLRNEQERSAQLQTYAADLSRTYSELRRHLNHLTVLHEVNTRIASALDPDEVLTGVLDSLGQLLTYQTAAIYLLDLDVAVAAEGPNTLVPANTLPRLRAGRAFDDGPLHAIEGSVARDDSMVLDVMRDQHTVGRMTPSGSLALAVPLKAGGRALGALELRLAEPLSEDDVKIVELLAAGAAVALQNAYLYQQTQRLATTDALTGLSNYRHFHDLLSLEVQRAQRMEYPIGLLIMDLDHFKRVNDRHGHPIGDIALRQVADQFRARLRRTDVVGRLGGEEFGAILPGDSLAEVAIVAEKLRHSIEELPPLRGGMASGTTQLTLSVGGTSLGWQLVGAEQLISCADQALYEAKRNGRNQVRLWTNPVPPETKPVQPSERRTM